MGKCRESEMSQKGVEVHRHPQRHDDAAEIFTSEAAVADSARSSSRFLSPAAGLVTTLRDTRVSNELSPLVEYVRAWKLV